MTRRPTLIIALMAMLLVLLASSCRSNRDTATKQYTPADGWTDITVPVKARVRAPSQISVSGRLTMVRDSVISLSLRVLGTEVAAAYLTTDTVVVAAKIKDRYYSGSAQPVFAALDCDMQTLQCMLTGLTVSDQQLPEDLLFDLGRVLATVGYGDMTSINPSLSMPSSTDIAVVVGDSAFALTLVWDVAKARVDTGTRPAPPSVRGCRPIRPDEISAMLK